MKKPTIPKKFLEKRIPTILGISVLVIALVAGTLLIGQGGGIFAPRASAETTPKKVKITNIHDTSFTISFLTDNKTAGFVKYGTEANSIKSQAGDDRDQISGTVGEFQLHHITVRGLQQNTTYYYAIGTGSGSIFDDDGQPFRIKTASRNGAPAAAKTIYGSVTNQAGAPANGSVVYVDVSGAGTMSSQVKASGSWAIPLSNARTRDGSGYATIVDDDNIVINVQGPLSSQVASFNASVANAQPVAEITFGQSGGAATAEPAIEPTIAATPRPTPVATPTVTSTPRPTAESAKATTGKSNLDSLLDEDLDSSASAITAITQVDLDSEEHQTVTTTDPIIIGKAPLGTTVSITVNSETQIQQDVTVDENGEFTLDISKLSESLEPGEHTATYSYTDPTTGEIVEKTVEFTVDNTVEQLALADTESAAPYGSGNPYPIETPILASDSATATDEARTTVVATDEAVPVSGSVGTTLALVFGGLFFIISGLWSFWISTQLEKGELGV